MSAWRSLEFTMVSRQCWTNLPVRASRAHIGIANEAAAPHRRRSRAEAPEASAGRLTPGGDAAQRAAGHRRRRRGGQAHASVAARPHPVIGGRPAPLLMLQTRRAMCRCVLRVSISPLTCVHSEIVGMLGFKLSCLARAVRSWGGMRQGYCHLMLMVWTCCANGAVVDALCRHGAARELRRLTAATGCGADMRCSPKAHPC